jgi:ferric-dicitrate binding protein FerR (iron transport regulator)
MRRVTRRELIRSGLGALAALLLLRNPFRLIASSREDDWEMPEEGRLRFVLGDVTVNGEMVGEGDPVSAGDILATGAGAEAEVEIRDHSIFHIKENSQVEVSNILDSPRLKVKRGWFLIIIRKGTDYHVETPTVLAGVRGTVFFVRVDGSDKGYFCDCNGSIDVSDSTSGQAIMSVKSQYHKAFRLNREPNGEVSMNRAGLLYHKDSDILRMAKRFSKETRIFRVKQREGTSGY